MNYIFTEFDNRRITDIGKKSVVGTPSNFGLILEHITTLTEVPILSETVEKV